MVGVNGTLGKSGFCVNNLCELWWLLSYTLSLSAAQKLFTPLNISCKNAHCNLWETGGVSDGWCWRPEAANEFEVDEATHIRACDISAHHQSLPLSPVDIWHMHQQTHCWKWIEPNPDKNTHIHTVSEAMLHTGGLGTRRSACSQLTLMYYSRT